MTSPTESPGGPAVEPCPGCAGRGYLETPDGPRPCTHCNGTGVMGPDGEPPEAIGESPPV